MAGKKKKGSAERKRMEEALTTAEGQLRLALEGGGMGIWYRDFQENSISWSEKMYEFLNRDPEGEPIPGETFFEYIHPEDLPRVRDKFEKTVAERGPLFREEFRVVREDGRILWLASAGRISYDRKGEPLRMAGVNFDITERKHLERELHRHREELEDQVRERTRDLEEINQELQEEIERRKELEAELNLQGERLLSVYNQRVFLSRRLVQLLEKDRRDIGAALHDHIGQILTGANMRLERLKKDIHKNGPPPIEQIEATQESLRRAVREVKRLSQNLRPQVLDRFGLIPAVRGLIQELQAQSGVDISFSAGDLPGGIAGSGKDLTLFRVVQEGLHNILKHARAQKASVSLTGRDDGVALRIEDDGVGFDYEGFSNSGVQGGDGLLGIAIMRERVAQDGGSFVIESRPGRGTQIIADIPLADSGVRVDFQPS